MPTEKEFLDDPTICDGCKAYWREYRQLKQPWVCADCARLERKAYGRGPQKEEDEKGG